MAVFISNNMFIFVIPLNVSSESVPEGVGLPCRLTAGKLKFRKVSE